MYIYSKTHGLRQTDAGGAKGDPTSVVSPEQASLSQSRSQSGLQSQPNAQSQFQSHSESQSQSPSRSRSQFSSSSPGIVLSPPLPSSSASAAAPGQQKPKSRRRSLPFSFPPLFFQPNISSASLAPSTAEGRPIPLNDTVTAHRTSALQKLNSTYPSTVVRGHRYAKSTGAQSSTYSQPVLVRTYSGPSPSQTSYNPPHRYRPSSGSRGASRRVPLPLSSRSGANLSSRPTKPSLSGPGTGSVSNGSSIGSNGNNPNRVSMPHHKSKKSSSKLPLPLPLPLPWQWQAAPSRQESDEAKLPPLEAFSFKSFLADMEAQGGENDIGADLDRIAEICARSRYSLSNQYEVHVTPHGSGVSFVAGGGSTTSSGQRRRGHNHSHSGGGPTLQAINSDDDEGAARSGRKRRGAGGRRRSAAYGTLETIMSSSRSSEEDKSKKKSAAELKEEVRGRAAQKAWDNSTGSGSASTANGQAGSQGGTTPQESVENNSQQDRPKTKSLARKKSAAFATAVMDSSRSTDAPSLRSSASALLSEPALPQTSNSHLGVRSGPDSRTGRDGNDSVSNSRRASRTASSFGGASNIQKEAQSANELSGQRQQNAPSGEHGSGGVHLGWGAWIPWRGGGQATAATPSRGEAGRRRRPSSNQSRDRSSRPPPNRETPSHAEGSLRQLLRAVDGKDDKGKAVVDRAV
ncbi:hypothetical protein B0T19DRAFT_175785 [Cercophora scortea]|uniref:Uncharacterized protein n=1 Tax=Cercophora scortea TaxID=314031 RepID=A0AAE0INZ4_9PEZI|nr:hypothetical protein B0T19DRAFT_175785 [Cercophora scortea]